MRVVCFTVWLIFLLPAKATEVELNVDWILKSPNAPELLDSLPPERRMQAIRDLTYILRNDSVSLAIPKLLCVSAPWTTGDAETDTAIQQYSWEKMAALDPQGPRFRWLDCVAANRVGGYRESSLSPLYDLRQSYCTGVPISNSEYFQTYLNQIERGIEEFNLNIRRGLSAATTGGKPRYSHYPLRNEVRLATLRAARAVDFAKSLNIKSAREEFAAIAKQLNTVMEQLDYSNTRNGWVYHSDLKLLIALYEWLGSNDGKIKITELKLWKPALSDDVISDAIPKTTVALMKKNGATDYVDPVFIERILPGAADVTQECGGWRRRSFDTRELAAQIEHCASKLDHPPADAEELRDFDQCVNEYQASDWRVQFSSPSPVRAPDALKEALDLVQDLKRTQTFLELPDNQQKRISDNLKTPQIESHSEQYSRIVTRHGLLTEDSTALEQMFDELRLKHRPLMARRKIY